MVADGVKVAKSNNVEIRVGDGEIFEDFFYHVFGFTIGIGDIDAGGESFDAFFDVLVAVNGGGGGKNEVINVVVCHRFE